MQNVVIIGAGQAGFAVAARLRAERFDGAVTLIGEEADPPYQRPPLSKKYLTGEMTRDRLYLRPASYYDEHDIRLLTSCHVRSIDCPARTVWLDDREIGYDHLVIATGSAPRRLPADLGGNLDGLHYVRTLADVDRMRSAFREGTRLLIVGGGYIGLEAAAVAAQLGVETTLIEAAPRILQRVAAPETAEYFRALHTGKGVRLIEGVGLNRLTGADRVEGALLADGTKIAADFAIAGIGVAPCTDLAETAGLEIENGIRVDDCGRTSDPTIFAVGDCASFPHRGGRIRLESVPHAIDQANVVADVILGRDVRYHARPWFWSDQFNVKLQIVGLNTGYDRTIRREGAKAGSVSIWYFRAGRLVAVDAANDPAAYMTAKRWIESDRSPSPEAIADASIALKDIDVG